MATFEDIKKANETIETTNIKGKEYAEVNQRIKAFRMVYPEGSIITDMVMMENGVCTIKAVIKNNETVLGTGYAQEKESSSYINKTSYIENCETSAVGRALGMCGFGIDTSVCSADELQNALNNQGNGKPGEKSKADKKEADKEKEEKLPEYATEAQIDRLMYFYENHPDKLTKFLNKNGVTSLTKLPYMAAQAQLDRMEAAKKINEAKARKAAEAGPEGE